MSEPTSSPAPTEVVLVDLPTIVRPTQADVALITEEGGLLAARVLGLEVIDQETFEVGSEILTDIKLSRKAVTETLGPMKRDTDQAHKTAVALFKKADDPLASLETATKTKMETWADEEERRRQVEEINRRAEAKKIEDDRRLAEAAAHEKAGDHEAAEEAASAPAAPTAPAKSQKIAAKGTGVGKKWSAALDPTPGKGLVELIAAAADPKDAGHGNALAVLSDEGVIAKIEARGSAMARAMKGQTRIPGFIVSSGTKVSSRG